MNLSLANLYPVYEKRIIFPPLMDRCVMCRSEFMRTNGNGKWCKACSKIKAYDRVRRYRFRHPTAVAETCKRWRQRHANRTIEPVADIQQPVPAGDQPDIR